MGHGDGDETSDNAEQIEECQTPETLSLFMDYHMKLKDIPDLVRL